VLVGGAVVVGVGAVVVGVGATVVVTCFSDRLPADETPADVAAPIVVDGIVVAWPTATASVCAAGVSCEPPVSCSSDMPFAFATGAGSGVAGKVSSTTAAPGTNAACSDCGAESKIDVFTRAAALPAPITPTSDSAVMSELFIVTPR